MKLEKNKMYWCSYRLNKRFNKKTQVKYLGRINFLGDNAIMILNEEHVLCIIDDINIKFFECNYELYRKT